LFFSVDSHATGLSESGVPESRRANREIGRSSIHRLHKRACIPPAASWTQEMQATQEQFSVTGTSNNSSNNSNWMALARLPLMDH
jgi:hypothetical protein